MDELHEQYMGEVNEVGLLDHNRMVQLGRQWRDRGDEDARAEMINANLRLVVSIAHRWHRRVPLLHLSFNDLVGYGNEGLIKAVDKWDPERGFRFSTYARWWIDEAIQHAVDRREDEIRSPEGNLSRASLDQEDEEGDPWIGGIADPQADFSEISDEQKQRLAQLMERLDSALEREVVKLRFGLVDEVPRKPRWIATVLGVKSGQVESLLRQAARVMRAD